MLNKTDSITDQNTISIFSNEIINSEVNQNTDNNNSHLILFLLIKPTIFKNRTRRFWVRLTPIILGVILLFANISDLYKFSLYLTKFLLFIYNFSLNI